MKGEGMTYQQAIREARERYKEAMDGAAADAVFIHRSYERSLSDVCRDIAGDDWNALRRRAQRFAETAGQTAEEAARRSASERARKDRAAAKTILKNPEQAAKVIASLPPQALDEVYHEARLARAGEDRSPAARKAARASASNAVAPLKRAVASTSAALCVEALREAAEDLREALDEDTLTGAALGKIEKAHAGFVDVLTEAALRMEGVGA